MIRHIEKLLRLGIKKDDFCLVQSAWFPIMGIRMNNDLDFILRSHLVPKYKDQIIKIKGLNIKINNPHYHKFGCTSDDDLIDNYSVSIDGLKFCYFKFYFEILKNRPPHAMKKDKNNKSDIENVLNFFKMHLHLHEIFKSIPFHTWFPN